MQQFLNYTVSGLGTAAVYAIAAAGLVLTYATTGVFNFAHGATSMLGAFTYWEMRFAWGWPAPVALLVCLGVLAPAFGVGLERGIMRHLVGRSETTRVVTTISLMIGLLGLALWVWDPVKARPIRRFWEGDVLSVGGVRIAYHVVVALAVSALLALGLCSRLLEPIAGPPTVVALCAIASVLYTWSFRLPRLSPGSNGEAMLAAVDDQTVLIVGSVVVW
mgnify:CR=1 FL=1